MVYNNSVSWNMGILQKLIDFANETSIHCLSFVVQTSASKLKRLTWAFLFVASLYYASFQLKQAFQCKFFWLTFKPAFPTNSKSIGLAIQGSVVWSLAPGTWKSCQSGWKFMDSLKNPKAFIQMTKRIQRTLGHNECCGAPSPRLFPTCNLCERNTFAKYTNKKK